eukprot:sb/3479381/
MKSLRARLQLKEERIIDNILILLDTLVKNCGRRFHLQMATREFMCDLIRLVSPRDPNPQHTKDRALTLIEQCSDAFGDDKDLAAVKEAYQYLKSQNVTFPARNLDDMVAIHTPRPETKHISTRSSDPPSPPSLIPTPFQSHSVIDPPIGSQPPPPTAAAPLQQPPPAPTQPTAAPAGGPPPAPGYHPSGISVADLQRLNKELLVVRGNDGVMNDILTDLQNNSTPKTDELQLLRLSNTPVQDLHSTCREMHRRMMELLEQVEEEGLVCQLLDLIDKLNNTFIRYERYERNLTMASPPDATGGPMPLESRDTPQQQADSRVGDVDLIGLNDEPTPSTTTQEPPAAERAGKPFGDMISAPVSRLPPVGPSAEDENIYTTTPVKIPAEPPVSTDDVTLQADDPFDMFAQTRTSTLSEQANIGGPEIIYEVCHKVLDLGSLSNALNSRKPNTAANDDSWLRDLNTVQTSSNAMTSEEFDAFLNERAPPPPSTALPSNPAPSGGGGRKKEIDDLLH